MSDRLERLLGKARARDFFEGAEAHRRPPQPTEKNAIKGDSFDAMAWAYITDTVPALKENVDDLGGDYPTSPAAYEDLFRILNTGDPRLIDPNSMDPAYRPQGLIADALLQAEDLGYLRHQTKLNEYNTAIAMLTMKERMRDNFDKLKDSMDALAAAEEALQQAMQAAQDFLNAQAQEGEGGEGGEPGGSGGVPAPGGEGQPGEGEGSGTPVPGEGEGEGEGPTEQEVMDNLQKAIQQLLEAQGMTEDQAQALARAAAQGVREASKEIDRQNAAASAYGLDDGDLQRVPFDERARLTGRLDSEKMKTFANLVGQFTQQQDAESRRKVIASPSEVYDVELGNDLTKMTASEVNNLAMPELEDLVWLRWAKHELQQWLVRGRDNAGKGPIIYVMDESGSMGAAVDAEGNTREMWGKAVALALAGQAIRGKRDFHYIGFSSQRQVWHMSAEKGRLTLDQKVQFVEHLYGGGTAYEEPLTRAMEIVREYADRGMVRPDIVFATDDDCYVGDEFIQSWQLARQATDVQCYGIRIGGNAHRQGSAMGALCDQLISVDYLTARPEDVNALWRQI